MKKLAIALVCLLLAGAAGAWYFLRTNDKARNVLPADATSVAVLDPIELIEGLGLSPEDVGNLDGDMKDLIEAFDLTNPVYAFATEGNSSCIALNVRDADKLKKAASNFNFASEEQSGYQWIASSNAIGCFDKEKLLLCGPVSTSEQNALRPELLKLMKQSGQEVPILEKVDGQKGFLRLCSSLNSIPKDQLPPGYDASGAFLNTSLSFGKQDITFSAKVEDKDGKPYSGRPEGEELLCPIKGLLPTVLPDQPFAWFSIGVKGEQLLKFLRIGPQVSAMLMMLNVTFFDADLLLKAINGDVVVMMPKADLERHEVLITAEISNSDFLKNADDWDTTSSVDDMGLRKRGENDYVFSFQGEQVFWGVRGGLLYISSSESLANQVLQESGSGLLQPKVAGKYMCGSIDIAQLVQNYAPLMLILSAVPQLHDAVTAIDKLTFSADTPQSFELSLQTNKPVKDVMSNLVKLLSRK